MNFTEHNPLGSLILNACNQFDKRIALKTPDEALSYRELHATATGLAGILDQLGIGRDSLVGMHIRGPGVKVPIAILALTLLGAKWIEYGGYLKGHESVQLTHLLHDDPTRPEERFSILINSIWPQVRSVGDGPDFNGFASAEDVWFMPSSSGTTGAKKTMAVSGRAFYGRVSRLTEYSNDSGDFSAADLFMRHSNLSCLHFFHTLSLGGTYISSRDYHYLLEQGVKLLVGSPHQLSGMLADIAPPESPQLNEVRVVGGALLPALLTRLLRYFRAVRVSYGSTETGPVSTKLLSEPTSDTSLGRCYPDVELEIVDEDDQLLGADTEGIVRIRTSTQVSGYLRDGGVSDDAFQNGWFFPGDRGRLSSNGEFYVVGRIQDVLNVAGVKINVARIDSILQSANEVQDALCFVEVAENGLENLAALIVLVPDTDRKQLIKDLIRSLLAEQYQVNLLPRNIYQVEKVPRNANGKAMRHEALAQVTGLKPVAQIGK